MGIYEKYFLPKFLNLAMQSPALTKLRAQMVPQATGKVLEVGIGSGLNLPFYSKGVQVIGVDPSVELQEYAREVANESQVDVDFIAQGCEDLPLGSDSIDTAVVTWTFCTIPEPEVALAEIRRVLKPNGKLVFVEHGQAKEANIAKWQDRINPIWKVIGGGCNLNRKPDETIAEQGFKFESLHEGYVKGPKVATYNYHGIARIA